MRFTFISNASFGRGKEQFELHRCGCADIAKHGRENSYYDYEADTVEQALHLGIDAEMQELSYTVHDVKVFNCAKGGRSMSEAKQNIKKSLKPVNKMTKDQRDAAIADAIARKAEAEALKRAEDEASAASKKAIEETVKPEPTVEEVSRAVAAVGKRNLKKQVEKVDKELNNAMVEKPNKEKPAKDPNELTVSDVARELGVEPKAARAKLRRSKGKATDGRWPAVKRDSEEHKALIVLLKAEETE
jgi:hypothetical protein